MTSVMRRRVGRWFGHGTGESETLATARVISRPLGGATELPIGSRILAAPTHERRALLGARRGRRIDNEQLALAAGEPPGPQPSRTSRTE